MLDEDWRTGDSATGNFFVSEFVGMLPCGINKKSDSGVLHRRRRIEYTFTYLLRCLECPNTEVIKKENHPEFIEEIEEKKGVVQFWGRVGAQGKEHFNFEKLVSNFEDRVNQSLKDQGILPPVTMARTAERS